MPPVIKSLLKSCSTLSVFSAHTLSDAWEMCGRERYKISNAVLAVALSFGAQAHAGRVANNALPTNGVVSAGQAAIAQSGNQMTVTQSSQRAVINWQTFDVGAQAKVEFKQPDANASTLNRVASPTASMIKGAVNANGQVVIVNPNGVVIGKGAEVNTGGLVASTLDIADQAFMQPGGKLTFTGGQTGKVVNKGKITVNNLDGYVALMAPEVRNEGVIVARMSQSNAVALASGQQVTLSFSDNKLTGVTVDASLINSLIENKRLIQTEGGQIVIAANSAADLKTSVVRNTGTLVADTALEQGGKISLVASSVYQAGVISADGNGAVANGGFVSILGDNITLASGSTTTAKGTANGGQVNIGTSSVRFTTNADGTRSNIVANNLAKTVSVETNALVDVSSTNKGNGGEINVWSSQQTSVAGNFNAMGGKFGGNGGTIETSSLGTLSVAATTVANASAPMGNKGNWLLDPDGLTIDASTAKALSAALATANVTVAVQGDLTVASNAVISTATVSASNTSTTNASNNSVLTLNASGALTNNGSVSLGQGANLVLNANSVNLASGSVTNANQVTATAQSISATGSVTSSGGSTGSVNLLANSIVVAGNVSANGSSSGSGSTSNSGTNFGSNSGSNSGSGAGSSSGSGSGSGSNSGSSGSGSSTNSNSSNSSTSGSSTSGSNSSSTSQSNTSTGRSSSGASAAVTPTSAQQLLAIITTAQAAAASNAAIANAATSSASAQIRVVNLSAANMAANLNAALSAASAAASSGTTTYINVAAGALAGGINQAAMNIVVAPPVSASSNANTNINAANAATVGQALASGGSVNIQAAQSLTTSSTATITANAASVSAPISNVAVGASAGTSSSTNSNASSNTSSNTSTATATAGAINLVVYNGLANLSGTVSANSATGQAGVVAVAANDVSFTNAVVQANGTTGGSVFVTATSGNANLNNSAVAVNGTAANGGTILIAGQNQTQIVGSSVSANGVINGGLIVMTAPTGTFENSGTVQANGATGFGGTIVQSGAISTSLSGAIVEANGPTGGGNILIGRDFHASPLPGDAQIVNSLVDIQALSSTIGVPVNVPTSTLTLLDSTTSISANATQAGNGGNILLWGDGAAAVGNFSAKGGLLSGNGGLVETSGNRLYVEGISTNASAVSGQSGQWLLDPTNVTISASVSTNAVGTTSPAGSLATALAYSGASNIRASDIQNAINAGTSVNIVATGSITLNSALSFAITATGTTPTLTFDNRTGNTQPINLSAAISDSTSASGSGVNLNIQSLGGTIQASAALSVKGTVTIDNTNNGFITNTQNLGYANTAGASSAVVLNGVYAGGDIIVNAINNSGYGTASIGTGMTSTNGSIAITANEPRYITTSGRSVVFTAGNYTAKNNFTVNARSNGYSTALYSQGNVVMTAQTGVMSLTGYSNAPDSNNNTNGIELSGGSVTGASVSIIGTSNSYASGAVVINGNITSTVGAVSIAGHALNTAGLGGYTWGVNSTSSNLTITSAGGVSITADGVFLSQPTNGISIASNIINNGGGSTGVVIDSAANLIVKGITNNGSGGIRLTGGSGEAAGSISAGTIRYINGTLSSSAGGIILSMAQPDGLNGNPGAIESNLGLTSSNAAIGVNVQYNLPGGTLTTGPGYVANGVNINYRYIGSATPPNITATLSATGNYSANYGTGYDSTTALNWLRSSSNVSINTNGSTLFGLNPTAILAGLSWKSTIGGNSNQVQSATTLQNGDILSTSSLSIKIQSGSTYTINKAPLTITNTAATVVTDGVLTYGGLVGTSGFTTSGLISSISGVSTNDAVSGLSQTVRSGIVVGSGTSISASDVAVPGGFNATPSAATGTGLSNYTITYVGAAYHGAQGIDIYALDDTKTYGSNTTSTNNVSYSLSGNTVTTVSNVNGYRLGGGQTLGAGASISGLVLTSAGAATNATVGGGAGAGGAYTITPSAVTGTNLADYVFTYHSGLMTLSPKAITVTPAASVTYGNTLTLSSGIGITYSAPGLASGDSITSSILSYTPNGGSAQSTVPSTLTAGTYSGTLSASAATGSANFNSTNYTISYAAGDVTVNARPITITASNVTAPVFGTAYDLGSSAFTVTSGSLVTSNADAISSVTLKYAGSTSVGATVSAGTYNSTVIASAATGTGNFDSTNYAITYAAGNLTVNRLALTITAANDSKVYGDTSTQTNSISYSASSNTATSASNLLGYTLSSSLVSGTSLTGVTLTSSGASTNATVNGGTGAGGAYTITPSAAAGTGMSNYLITYATGLMTVTPKSVTVTANESVVYGSSSGTITYSTSGLASGDSVTSATVQYTTGGSPPASIPTTLDVGTTTGVLIASSATGSARFNSTNYNISYGYGNLTVTPKALTITANNVTTTYGAGYTLGTTAFTTNGLINSDAVSSVSLLYSGAASVPATTNAGVYNSSVAISNAVGTGLGNYSITYTTGKLTVNAATLTVTPNSATQTFNNTTLGTSTSTTVYSDNKSNYSITGFVNSDTATSTGLTLTGTMSFTSASSVLVAAPTNADSYVYGVGTLAGTVNNNANSVKNYTVSFSNPSSNAYTISPLALGLSVSMVYNGGTTVNSANSTITATTGISGQTVTIGGSGTALSANVADANSLSTTGMTITGGAGTLASNYKLPSAATTFKITPKSLTASLTGLSDKVYDGTTNATLDSTNYSLSGFVTVGGITQGASVNQTVGTYNSANVATATTVTASLAPSNFTANAGTDFNNYTLPNSASGTAHITKAPLTLTANDVTTYLGVSPVLTGYSVSGLVGTDTNSSALSGITVTNNATSNAIGTYTAVLAPNATSANYSLTKVNGTLTIISNYQLNITVGNSSATYGTYDQTSVTNGSITVAAAGVTAGYCTNCVANPTPGFVPTIVNLTVTAPTGSSTLWTATDNYAIGVRGSYTFSITPTIATGSYSTGGFVNTGTYTMTPSGIATVSGFQTNYDTTKAIVYTSGSLTINTLSLTFGALTPTKQYDGTTTISSQTIAANNVKTGDQLTVSGSGAFSTVNAGNTVGYSFNLATLSGADRANYAFTGPITGTTGQITAAPITVTSSDVIKTYDALTSVSGASTAPAAVLRTGTLYSVSGVQDSLFGGSFAYTDANAGVGNKTVTPSAVAVKNGSNVVSSNYSITYANNTTSTISKASVTLTGAMTYDGTTTVASGNLTASGVAGQTFLVDAATSGVMASANAGVNALTSISGLGLTSGGSSPATLSNYNLTFPVLGNVTVSPANLLLTPNAASATYNGTNLGVNTSNQAYSTSIDNYSVTGYVSGESSTNVPINLTGAMSFVPVVSSNTSPVNADIYSYAVGSLASSVANNSAGYKNYSVSFNATNNKYTINPAELNVSVSMVYNGGTSVTPSNSTFTVSGVGSQTATLSGSGIAASANVSDVNSLPMSGFSIASGSGTGFLASNYVLPTNAQKFTITPKTLTASLVSLNDKVYDSTTNATLAPANYSLSGFVTVGGVTEGATVTHTVGTFNSANVVSANSITSNLSPADFTANVGTNLSNYNLPASATGTAHITQAPLTLTANDVTTFIGVNPDLSKYSVAGLLGSDVAATSLSNLLITNSASSNAVGVYANALTPSATSSNYSITTVSGSLTIATNYQLVITAGNSTATYGTYDKTQDKCDLRGDCCFRL